MYKVLSEEYLKESFPILNFEEEVILLFISKDGITLHPVFTAIKKTTPNVENTIRKNFQEGTVNEGTLFLLKYKNKKVLIMPIKENWKEKYNLKYIEDGFLKLSSVYKERNINSIAIQEGVIPNDVIDQMIAKFELPKINYYENKE